VGVRVPVLKIWGRGERMRNRKWTGVFMRRKWGPFKGFSSYSPRSCFKGEPPGQFEVEFNFFGSLWAGYQAK
jgi:hypothetical protein